VVRVVASSSSSLSCELDEPVLYAAPRRRLTTGSHAEFVGALVHEFRSALASLKDAGEFSTRVAWLVRLLEAVDGDGSSRRVEPVHGATVARQAAAGHKMMLEVTAGADRDNHTFRADPERVRLGLEILFEALDSPDGSLVARLPAEGCLTLVAPALDLEEIQRRFALRSAFRVLDMESCQLRVRSVGDETRVEVRLGPRKK
jgi:hypothetical protein